ncbi:hypothetical protein [Jidongwangia harbinensis]|uniref:hypothetical protein n=1 Tax=Jidongwangia harbinensis TaxID=2878561 RepID=UPI001CD96A4B|nr:hypothetical protein [Jidongwangia harbinensis]MCA2215065.1 hypothetical protein [Jidongwangia harbinensis]
MRRALLVLTAGLLLATTACGTDQTSGGLGPGTSRPPAPAVGGTTAPTLSAEKQAALAKTKAVCESVGQAYTRNMGPFAESMSTMVAQKNAKPSREKAQQALSAFAQDIRTATQAGADTEARAAGKKTADQLQAKAADDTIFTGVKTAEDLETVLGPTLKEWLEPITEHCS